MKLDKETRQAMIGDLYECLEAVRKAGKRVVAIQLYLTSHHTSIPPLNNLLPFIDANKIMQDELAKWIADLEHPEETATKREDS